MLKLPCLHWSHTQKYRISMEHESWRLTVLLAMPTAVELSQCIGVAGCGCPISRNVFRSIMASLKFMNNAPSSASAADAATNLSTLHSVCIASFMRIGILSSCTHPMKKWPHARLPALGAERYEALLWVFSIIVLAQ